EVLDLIRADAALGRPLASGHPYVRAEVAYAVSHESALHLEDVLMRRTRLFIESADSGVSAAADVAAIMGRLLGWSRRRRGAETRRYLDLVEAGRAGPARAGRRTAARAALLRAQRAAIRDAGRAERCRLATALAGRGARHQPAGGAGPGPPGPGRPA